MDRVKSALEGPLFPVGPVPCTEASKGVLRTSHQSSDDTPDMLAERSEEFGLFYDHIIFARRPYGEEATVSFLNPCFPG